MHREEGQLTEAGECYAQALRLYREVGNRHAEWSCLGNLGVVLGGAGPGARRGPGPAVGAGGDPVPSASPSSRFNDIAAFRTSSPSVCARSAGPAWRCCTFPGPWCCVDQWATATASRPISTSSPAAYIDLGYHAKAQGLAQEVL